MSNRAGSVPGGAQGLLSLSLAAATAVPISVPRDNVQDNGNSLTPSSYRGSSSLVSGGGSSTSASLKIHPPTKHRRLSSSGQARRRLSDAREAASRPSPVTISTAAAALTSLAKLSLSATPPPQTSTTFVSATGVLNSTASTLSTSARNGTKQEVKDEEVELNGAGISMTSSKTGTGKKRGTIFKCESCSKVYRHPSCLIKHRWEHSPHWREASKFLLSKHQQVQLLEAAAILSHLSPSATGGTSLPEDRSLWPSYLSGGLLPPPNTASTARETATVKPTMSSFAIDQPAPFPTSSSVPAPSVLSSSVRPSSRAGSLGPRLHDYSVPAAGGITQLRPGVLGVPTRSNSALAEDPTDPPAQAQRSAALPVPMPNAHAHRQRETGYSFVSQPSDAWSSPVSLGYAQSSFRSSASVSASALGHSYSDGTGGWSLPRSSVRSSSRSRSGSEESEYVDVDGLGDVDSYGASKKLGFSARSRKSDDALHEKIEEEWDGMEMEMEM